MRWLFKLHTTHSGGILGEERAAKNLPFSLCQRFLALIHACMVLLRGLIRTPDICCCTGDDMGLGKTMQCAAFLAGLFNNCLIKCAACLRQYLSASSSSLSDMHMEFVLQCLHPGILV